MQLPEFLTRSADGEIQLTGHRIGLYHVIQYYNEGESAEMLASRYPTLPLSLVHKVIAFYLDNQADVDAYIAACVTVIAEQHGSARQLDLSALRQRLSASESPSVMPEPQAR
jgi:uncharacterized protein (DUF433 family)